MQTMNLEIFYFQKTLFFILHEKINNERYIPFAKMHNIAILLIYIYLYYNIANIAYCISFMIQFIIFLFE